MNIEKEVEVLQREIRELNRAISKIEDEMWHARIDKNINRNAIFLGILFVAAGLIIDALFKHI